MKNKISVYELLGLIKDGKIKEGTYISFYSKEYEELRKMYVCQENIISHLYCGYIELDDKVEILEEDRPIIEKIDLFDDLQDILNNSDESIVLNAIHKCLTTEKYKLNEVIDYINRREDK